MATTYIALPGSSGLIGPTVKNQSSVLFRGARLVESAGSPAAAYVTFRTGSSSGTIFYAIKVAASSSAGDPLNVPILVNSQVYYNIESGTVTGVAFFD